MSNNEITTETTTPAPTAPQEHVERAREMARLLTDIVEQGGLSLRLRGDEYLRYEAWQTIAQWYGCTVTTEWTRPVTEDGRVVGWEARVAVIDGHGRVVGASEGMCTRDESAWRGRPDYALRSMAQTRTAAKALRSLFAHIVVLAGYQPTPAEEMDDYSRDTDDKKIAGQPAATGKRAAMKTEEPATPAQRKALYARCLERGWDRETARRFADWVRGSAEHLEKYAVSDVLDHFDEVARMFEEDELGITSDEKTDDQK